MRTYIARQSSSGDFYFVATELPGDDAVYRQFAFDILGRRDALDPDFDSGNVDIDVFELPVPVVVGTQSLMFEGD